MTHLTPDDFDQLRGAFDDPVAPAPSFAARLREEIAKDVTKTVAPTDIRWTVEPLRAARQAESVPLTTWYGALATAAVIALVLALVFVTIRGVIAPGSVDDDDDGALSPATVPANSFGQASASGTPAVPELEISPSTSAGFAGADASWPISGVADELGDEIVEVPFVVNSETELTPNLGVVGTTGFTYGGAGLIAFDMTTNTILWTWKGTPPQRLVSDGQIVTFYSQNVPTAEFGLFGLDIATGAQRWLSTDPSSVGNDLLNNGPIIVDGVVYAGFDERIIRAIDAVTGETRWETSLDHEFGSRSFSPNPDGSTATRSFDLHITLVDAELYAFSGGRFLDVLSPSNGVVTRSAEPLPELATDTYDWRVFSVVDGVGYVGVTQSRIVSYATPIDGAYSGDVDEGHLYAVDLSSLTPLWDVGVEDAVGTVIDVGGPVIVVGSTFQRIDAESGDLTELADVGSGEPASMRGFPIQRTTGDRGWFVMELDEGFTVVELDASGITRTWSHVLEGAPVYADIVADPDGSLRILTVYGSTYVIPAANAVPESGYEYDEADSAVATSDADACDPGAPGATPWATLAGEQEWPDHCASPIPEIDPMTPAPDEGMYATNPTPEGRDSSGAEGEVPGSYRSQPTPAATIVDNIIQPDEPSPTVLPDGTPFAPIGEPTPIVASPTDGGSIIQPLDPSPTASAAAATPSSGFSGVDAAWTIEGVAPELGDSVEDVPGIGSAGLVPVFGTFGDIGLALAPDGAGLVGFDTATGEIRWTHYGSPGLYVVSDGKIAVFMTAPADASRRGYVAIDIATGEERWFAADPSLEAGSLQRFSPIIDGEVVYLGFGNRTIRAADLETGATRWETTLDHTWQDSPFQLEGQGESYRQFSLSMALVDERLVVLSGLQFIDAIALADGSVLGSVNVAPGTDNGFESSSMGIVGDVAYVSMTTLGSEEESGGYGLHGAVYAIDLSRFTVRWVTEMGSPTGTVVGLGGIPVAGSGSDIYRFDPIDGTATRFNSTHLGLGPWDGAQAGDGSRVWLTRFGGSGYVVYEIDAAGTVRQWEIEAPMSSMALGIWRIEADDDGGLLLYGLDFAARIAPTAGGEAGNLVSTPAAGATPVIVDGWRMEDYAEVATPGSNIDANQGD